MYSAGEKPSEFKLRLFRLLHNQLEMLQLDGRLFAVLLALQSLQLVGQAVNSGFDFLWPSMATGYLQLIVKWLDVGVLVEGGNALVLLALLCFTLVYLLLMLICIVVQLLTEKQAKPTSLQLYSLKFLNVLVVGIKTVLALPFWQTIVSGFACKQLLSGSPSPIVTILCTVLAALNCLLFLVLQALYTMLFVEPSPFKDSSIASPVNCNDQLKLLLKMLSATYLILDRTKSVGRYYIVVLTVLAGIWCFKSYSQQGYYSRPQRYVSQAQCALLFWVSFCVFIQAFICPQQFLGVYFTILGLPLTVVAWYQLKRIKCESMMCQTYKSIGDADGIKYFVLCMLQSIREIGSTEERMKLQGILNYHILSCKKAVDQCSCTDMADYQKRSRSTNEQFMWYAFVKRLLMDGLQRFPKATQLHLILAYTEHEKLNNKYKALFNLVNTEQTQPSLLEQFMSYHLQLRIQQRMVEEDQKANEHRAVDINKFFEFSNRLLQFRVILEETVNSYVQFWHALMEATPNLMKIKSLGSKITGENERATASFEQLSSMNGNNLECLEMYASFLESVVNDDERSGRLAENIKTIQKNLNANKNFLDEDRLKYGQNSQTGIIVISGNLHNLGVVQHCNTQVSNIIGYYMSDLIGQNINRIMPKVVGDHHDEVLRSYLDTSEQRLNGNQRFAPMINREGFLVPCTILTKSLPSLEKGIQLVGFFRPVSTENLSVDIENPHYVLFRQDTEEVQALSENIFKSYRIRKMKQLSTSQLNSQITIKSMFNVTFAEGLKFEENGQSGKLVSFNSQCPTSDQNNLTRSKIPTYRKEEVIVRNHTYLMYRGVPLRMIYFVSRKPSTLRVDSRASDRRSCRSETSERRSEQLDIQQIELLINEETRLLKDFQMMINDKKEPQSIRALSKIGTASFFLVVGLAVAALVLFQQRKSQIEEGQQAISLGGALVGCVAEVNYYSRKMQLEGVAAAPNNISYSWWQQNLSNTLNYLQNAQFDMVKLQINATNKGASTAMQAWQYTIAQKGTALKKANSLDLTLFDYITSISGWQSASLPELNFSLSSGSLNASPSKQYINFYNIRYTGLFSLLEKELINLQNMQRFYRRFINEGQISFVVLLASACCVVAAALVTAIPFIISVIRISNRVLSLFGYIQLSSIEGLVRNCESYIDNFLKDTATGKTRLKRQTKALEAPTQQVAPEQKDDEAKLLTEPPSEIQRYPSTASKKIMQFEQQRCQVLMQTRDFTSVRVILQYSLFSIVFLCYFLIDFCCVKYFLVSAQRNYDVALCLTTNINIVKQLKVVTMESIIDNGGYDGKMLLSESVAALGQQLYLSQRELNGYSQENFSQNFGNFFVARDLYNTNNLCSLIDGYSGSSRWFPSSSFSPEECTSLASGILPMGLKPSLVGYVQTCGFIYNSSLTAVVNGSSLQLLERLQKYLQTPLTSMSATFSTGFGEYLQQAQQTSSIKFSLFIILLLGMFVLAWLPFLRGLNRKIWMTKGMLSMIPLSMVSSNEKLKEQLISGSILNSVK